MESGPVGVAAGEGLAGRCRGTVSGGATRRRNDVGSTTRDDGTRLLVLTGEAVYSTQM